MSNPLLSFEHQILRRLAAGPPARRWLVACSGGRDSMVLAEVARRWRRKLCDRLIIAHVHHGRGPEHRDEAQALVREWSRAHGLPFVTNRPADAAVSKTESEASLRRLRFAHLERWRLRYGCDVICLGHHRDDLLETRLLRLVRGTGAVGLTAMRARDARRLRPLLDVSRAQISAYARGRDLRWCEDPSNAVTEHALRAWVRHAWVPALEARSPGATISLARSLAALAQPPVGASSSTAASAIRRDVYAAADATDRERIVRDYLRSCGARDYGRTHVREVVKRLDTRRKEFSFTLLGFKFSVTHQFWWASRVCDSPTPC